jgi:hypothetical protein
VKAQKTSDFYRQLNKIFFAFCPLPFAQLTVCFSCHANLPLKSEKMTFYADWYRIRLHLPPAFWAAQQLKKL